MLKDFATFSLALAIFLFAAGPVFAKKSVQDALPGRHPEVNKTILKEILSAKGDAGSDICGAVQGTIQEGIGARDVVKTAVELGHSACLVVKCALYAGGSVEEVIGGAVQAGATSDVVSRCALDAGAEAKKIERSLPGAGLSIGHVESEGNPLMDPPLPPPIPPPGPPPISPSSF